MNANNPQNPMPQGQVLAATNILQPSATGGPLSPLAPQPMSLAAQVLPPLTLSAKPTAMALLRALRRRWLQAFSAAVFAAVLVGAITWLVVPPAQYVSQAKLHAKQTQPKFIFTTKEDASDFNLYQRTQIELIKSRWVLTAALRNPHVAQCYTIRKETDPIDYLYQYLQVGFVGFSEILMISLSGDRPEDLPIIVNAVKDAYLREIVDADRKKRQDRLKMLEDTFRQYEKEIQDKQKLYRPVASITGVGPDSQKMIELRQKLYLERIETATKKHDEVKNKVEEARIMLALEKKRQEDLPSLPISEARIEEYLDKHPMVEEWRKQIKDAKGMRDWVATSSAKKEQDPDFKKHEKSIETLEGKIKTWKASQRKNAETELRDVMDRDVKVNISQIEGELFVMQHLLKLAEDDMKRVTADQIHITDKMLEGKIVQADITGLEALAKEVSSEVEKLKVEVDAPARITEIDRAVAPTSRDDKKGLKMAGMTAAVAFVVVLLGFAYWEFRSRRIDMPDEVATNLGIRLVGSLPDWTKRSPYRLIGSNVSQNAYWQNLLTESVDATRTMLLHTAQHESLQVVMITSAVGGEGKTSLSSHLAASLARAGRKTLLFDTDMRNPSAHRLFDMPLEPGLGELLRGEAPQAEAVRPTPINNLSIITAGRRDSEAIQALALKEFGDLLAQLRGQFDFIIVDSCPVLPVADSLLVVQHVDAVLFSIMKDVSQMPKVYSAYQRLAMLGVRILGAVINGTRADNYGSNYQYYVSRNQ